MSDEIRIYLSVNASRSNPEAWGDTRFATGLAQALQQIGGCATTLLFRGEQPEQISPRSVILRIAGPHLEEPVPGLPNMLWMISPPNLAPVAMLARYQVLFCGAAALTRDLRQRGLNAHCLPQATDIAHFHPSRRPADRPEDRVVFVGGYAPRVDRRLVLAAVQAGFEPQIWGPGWADVIPRHLWRGERLDHDELAQVYAGARVVLNSHMSNMARLGFMSNRSYDALAAGALVISDPVAGFSAPDLPELQQVRDPGALRGALGRILAAAPLDAPGRLALHARLAASHGFDARARVIATAARQVVERGDTAPAAYQPGRRQPVTPPAAPDGPPGTGRAALEAAAAELLVTCRRLELDLPPAPPETGDDGIIHALMADLRESREIASRPPDQRPPARLEALAARARRLSEALADRDSPLRLHATDSEAEMLLVRVLRNEPLWPHGPEGFQRDGGKQYVPLWPRRQAVAARPPGVFLHLFHADLAPVFAERLAHIAVPYGLYVSTDTEAKAQSIRASLPEAEIRVLENRGRDIWPKLYGFRDAHARHEVVLHLHGKKSPHSGRLDDWLDHILGCLLGSVGEVNRILSLFEAIPRLGMVVPVVFRSVLGAAHWGANLEIGRELAARMALPGPLPSDSGLRFPVGSMFWARTAALQPLLDLDLKPRNFPPEAGQLDGTLAHAIERMLGVTCRAGGHHILPVGGAGARLHVRHQLAFGSNGALRRALEAGAFES